MNHDLNQVAQSFQNIVHSIAPNVVFWTLRLTEEKSEAISVRQGVMQPVYNQQARGALLTFIIGDGSGYAATSDLSVNGLTKAAAQASEWAKQSAGMSLLSASDYPRPEDTAFMKPR